MYDRLFSLCLQTLPYDPDLHLFLEKNEQGVNLVFLHGSKKFQ